VRPEFDIPPKHHRLLGTFTERLASLRRIDKSDPDPDLLSPNCSNMIVILS
jgi:hypothetical protein